MQKFSRNLTCKKIQFAGRTIGLLYLAHNNVKVT